MTCAFRLFVVVGGAMKICVSVAFASASLQSHLHSHYPPGGKVHNYYMDIDEEMYPYSYTYTHRHTQHVNTHAAYTRAPIRRGNMKQESTTAKESHRARAREKCSFTGLFIHSPAFGVYWLHPAKMASRPTHRSTGV
ncbi:hypothetical protein F4777DRAFT_556658 [Nemania sp. FL0916]|nr:hypothetical protein F4777DRAFT_556658 [Nemania sp. FL0916]